MKKLLLISLLIANFTLAFTQGTTVLSQQNGAVKKSFVSGVTTAPAASAILEGRSTTKGFLMPRMTNTQRNAIASPATGLQVYNTTTNRINYYDGIAWFAIDTAVNTNWNLTGNAITSTATKFIGTTDLTGFNIKTNNIYRYLIDSVGNHFIQQNGKRYVIQNGTTFGVDLTSLFSIGGNSLDPSTGLLYVKVAGAVANTLKVDSGSLELGRTNFGTGRKASIYISSEAGSSPATNPDIVIEAAASGSATRYGISMDTNSCEIYSFDPATSTDIIYWGVDDSILIYKYMSTPKFWIDTFGQISIPYGAGVGKSLMSNANGGASWVGTSNGTSAPATTPTYIGQLFVDTSAKKLYFATGTSSSADWTIAN